MNNFPLSFLLTILALVLVLLLAWFSIRLLSRFSKGNIRNGRIHITHTLPVGTREKLMLVNLDEQTYFLGVTANGITVLDQKPVIATPDNEASIRPTPG